jgi:hypothetical protein
MIDMSMIEGLCVPIRHIFKTSIPKGFWPCAMSSTIITIEGGSGEEDTFSSSRMEMHDNFDMMP